MRDRNDVTLLYTEAFSVAPGCGMMRGVEAPTESNLAGRERGPAQRECAVAGGERSLAGAGGAAGSGIGGGAGTTGGARTTLL